MITASLACTDDKQAMVGGWANVSLNFDPIKSEELGGVRARSSATYVWLYYTTIIGAVSKERGEGIVSHREAAWPDLPQVLQQAL